MYEDLYDEVIYDITHTKTADDVIAVKERDCVFNTIRRKNDRIRKNDFDYEEYITSEINKYVGDNQSVDTRISEMINQIRNAADKQHAQFLTKLNYINSIMDGSCPVDAAFEYAYEELHTLFSWFDELDVTAQTPDIPYRSLQDYEDCIRHVNKSEFKEIIFDTNKYKKLLSIPYETESDYRDFIYQLKRQIRDYMYERDQFDIYNNLTPAIIELFRSECMHPGTVVFVNGRFKTIHNGAELRKILRQRLPINIRTSEEFKTTADKYKHHNRFDMDIDLIKEEA